MHKFWYRRRKIEDNTKDVEMHLIEGYWRLSKKFAERQAPLPRKEDQNTSLGHHSQIVPHRCTTVIPRGLDSAPVIFPWYHRKQPSLATNGLCGPTLCICIFKVSNHECKHRIPRKRAHGQSDTEISGRG
jgi:hypothetical protein